MNNKAIDLEGLGLFGEGVKKYIQDNRTHWTDPDGTVHKLPKEYLPDDIGGSVLSWNSMEDKPFGETEGYIVPETPVTFVSDDGEGMFVGVEFSLTVGEKYTVNWNGTDYECTAQEFADPESSMVMGAVVGDLGAMMGGESTGEPFIIVTVLPEMAAILGANHIVLTMDGSTEVTASIKGKSFTYLDPKYIKDMYCTGTEKTYILPPTTVEPPAETANAAFIETDLLLEVGETYIVNWRGVDYITTAKEVLDTGYNPPTPIGIAIGNYGAMSGGTDTGEPFVIMKGNAIGDDNVCGVISSDGYSDLVISISIGEEVIHKIPNKYLDLSWLPTEKTDYEQIIPEKVYEFNDRFYNEIIDNIPVKAGKNYVVTWDGTEYICDCWQGDVAGVTGLNFGDSRLAGGSAASQNAHPTDEPFQMSFCEYAGSYILRIWTESVQPHTIAITGTEMVEQVNKMPEKYMPESVEGVVIRSSTEGSTKKFKLTVDDSGTITATEITD